MVKVVISLILLIDVIKSTYNGIKNRRSSVIRKKYISIFFFNLQLPYVNLFVTTQPGIRNII